MDANERYQNIVRKENELRRREQALKKQNVEIEDTRPPNFPPFCPVIYHNIPEEIPTVATWCVRISFFSFWFIFPLVVINFIGCCMSGKWNPEKKTEYDVATNVVFSIIISIILVFCAFRVNYMSLYQQCKESNVRMSMIALQALYICFYAVGFAGFKNTGMVGIMSTIDSFSRSKNAGSNIICVIATLLWALEMVCQIFLFGRIMMLWKMLGKDAVPSTL